MRIIKKHLRFVVSLLFIITLSFQFLYSQGEKGSSGIIKLENAGLSIGWFNPSLDYWKNESEFKDAVFGGAIDVAAVLDLKIIDDFHGKIGLGYWQESTKYDLQGFGNTTLLITGIPINVDFVYKIRPLKFLFFTPFIGEGAEYLFVQHILKFDLNEDTSPQTGTTILGHVIAGFESKLSEQFALDLEFQYKFGNYKQDFEINDPSYPENNKIVTETISLSGPRVGITLKYFF